VRSSALGVDEGRLAVDPSPSRSLPAGGVAHATSAVASASGGATFERERPNMRGFLGGIPFLGKGAPSPRAKTAQFDFDPI
jgi:hypothetical protein